MRREGEGEGRSREGRDAMSTNDESYIYQNNHMDTSFVSSLLLPTSVTYLLVCCVKC